MSCLHSMADSPLIIVVVLQLILIQNLRIAMLLLWKDHIRHKLTHQGTNILILQSPKSTFGSYTHDTSSKYFILIHHLSLDHNIIHPCCQLSDVIMNS